MADDSDDEILSRKPKKLPPAVHETATLEDSDDDKPLNAKLAQKRKSIEKNAEKEAKAIRAHESKQKKPAPKKAARRGDAALCGIIWIPTIVFTISTQCTYAATVRSS